jgi:L-ascorbate metabolism protein UlaG (beta-lactamase superfamily)
VHYDPKKPHHTATGFRNNYPHPPIGQGFWKWQWQRLRDGVPKHPEGGYNFPLAKPDAAFLRENRSQPTLTWIGHATLLLQLGGVNILTDPHLTERASPLSFYGPKRWMPPALDFAELPHIDVVVISHNHYDHLDLDTVTRLNRQPGGPPAFYVPLGLKQWFADTGISNVVELDWWAKDSQASLSLHFVPVQHWSTRTRFDRNQSLWGAWVIEHGDFRFIFCGDTGYSKDFQDIGARFGGFDLAAIPVGSYEPRWFMQPQHVNPGEAVQVHRDLKARYSVGIHWGTFVLTDEPLDEPPRKLTEALETAGVSDERFFLMQHGETRMLAPLMRRETLRIKSSP